jgi:uncharacterized membrane protein HdeD (DUF308 family)
MTMPPHQWLVTLGRAAAAIVVAILVTFSPDHSPTLGFLAFGGFALATGLVLLLGSFVSVPEAATRAFVAAHGVLTVTAGVVALSSSGAGLPFLIFLVSSWAALTGFLELYVGLRNRGRSALARDWTFVGIVTALFAVAVLLVPPDLRQSLGGVEDVDGELTASIVVVGAIGAYAAIVGVYLAIAGVSLRFVARDEAMAEKAGGNR